MMKSLVRELVPQSLIEHYGRLKLRLVHRKNHNNTAEEVFAEIYEMNSWVAQKENYAPALEQMMRKLFLLTSL